MSVADDEGEVYTLASGIKNDTLFSYMRPVYISRSFDFVALIATELAETSNKTMSSTDELILATDEIPTDNSTNVNVQILSTNDIENTCYPIAKKIRIESTTSEQIAMFEFQAYSLGANVALQGKATQSSDRNNGQLLAASRAIDGDNITFSHTNDLNAFWEVDLDQSYSIESITILNR